MFADIRTVVWKDVKEYVALSRPQHIALRITVLVATIGLVVPLRFGMAWLTSSISVLYWCWFGCFLIVGPAANALVRERRSNCFEMLLASRLSDGAIVWGKVIAGTLYAFSFVAASMAAGMVFVNLAEWRGTVMTYSAQVIAEGAVLCLLSMCLLGGVCFLLCVKVKETVRTVQVINFVVLVLAVPAGIVYWRAQSAWTRAEFVKSADSLLNPSVVAAAVVALVIANAAVYALIKSRFNRARLIV